MGLMFYGPGASLTDEPTPHEKPPHSVSSGPLTHHSSAAPAITAAHTATVPHTRRNFHDHASAVVSCSSIPTSSVITPKSSAKPSCHR